MVIETNSIPFPMVGLPVTINFSDSFIAQTKINKIFWKGVKWINGEIKRRFKTIMPQQFKT